MRLGVVVMFTARREKNGGLSKDWGCLDSLSSLASFLFLLIALLKENKVVSWLHCKDKVGLPHNTPPPSDRAARQSPTHMPSASRPKIRPCMHVKCGPRQYSAAAGAAAATTTRTSDAQVLQPGPAASNQRAHTKRECVLLAINDAHKDPPKTHTPPSPHNCVKALQTVQCVNCPTQPNPTTSRFSNHRGKSQSVILNLPFHKGAWQPPKAVPSTPRCGRHAYIGSAQKHTDAEHVHRHACKQQQPCVMKNCRPQSQTTITPAPLHNQTRIQQCNLPRAGLSAS